MTTRILSDKSEKSVRVFFALCTDYTIQKQLAHFAKILVPTCGGRPIKTQHIHLTLAFLGNLAINRLPELHGCMVEERRASKNLFARLWIDGVIQSQ